MSSNGAGEPAGAPDTRRGPIGARLFRSACARFATGVAVVTVTDAEGRPHGLTVNSFTSLSLDPPLVLISIDLRNSILGHFLAASYFAINILAEGQESLSLRFSSVSENRFAGIAWRTSELGLPLLDGALAHLECAVIRPVDAGDHTVLMGEVRAADYSEGRPLVYFSSGYRRLDSGV